MPLNAVQQYLKTLYDQQPLPAQGGTLNAYVAPPDPGDGTDPALYIWGSVQVERRRSMPRAQPGLPSTGGFKTINHKVDMWLIWFGPADAANADSQFPLVIDFVTKILRTTQMPVLNLVDPQTGDRSNVDAIGEEMNVDYAPVHSVDDERYLAYTARIIVDVREQIQA